MSYENSKLVRVQTKTGGSFTGGYIDNIDNIFQPDNSCSYIRNGRLKGGAIKIRPGYSEFSTTLTLGQVPISIGRYYKAGVSNKLIVRHNQDTSKKLVLIDESGVLTEIDTLTYITSDNKMNFTNAGDKIYCRNGIDNGGFYNGTVYDLPTLSGDRFKASFSVIFDGSMWIGGIYDTPNKIRQSVSGSYEDFTGTGSDNMDFGEAITGITYANENLYIFTKNTISYAVAQTVSTSVVYNFKGVNAKEGSINHQSIVNVGVNTYFLTPNNKIQILQRGLNNSGFEIVELSHRQYGGIDNFMTSLDNNQTDSFGIYLEKENIIKWYLKKDGSSINDTCVIYDIINDKFLIDEYKYFNGSIMLNGQQYSISAIENKIFKDEFGNDDDGSAIDFEYHTKIFDFGDRFRKKILREVLLSGMFSNITSLILEIWLNNTLIDTKSLSGGSFTSSGGIGISAIGVDTIGEDGVESDNLLDFTIYRTKGHLNKKGNTIQYIIKSNTLGGNLSLQDLQHRIEILGDAQINLTS